jgi:hypothetical protein
MGKNKIKSPYLSIQEVNSNLDYNKNTLIYIINIMIFFCIVLSMIAIISLTQQYLFDLPQFIVIVFVIGLALVLDVTMILLMTFIILPFAKYISSFFNEEKGKTNERQTV